MQRSTNRTSSPTTTSNALTTRSDKSMPTRTSTTNMINPKQVAIEPEPLIETGTFATGRAARSSRGPTYPRDQCELCATSRLQSVPRPT